MDESLLEGGAAQPSTTPGAEARESGLGRQQSGCRLDLGVVGHEDLGKGRVAAWCSAPLLS